MTGQPWDAYGDGWGLHWRPDPPHIEGTPEIVAAVAAVLAEPDSTIAVTPTGPFVSRDESEPLAVLAALGNLGREHITANAPTIENVPVDAVA